MLHKKVRFVIFVKRFLDFIKFTLLRMRYSIRDMYETVHTYHDNFQYIKIIRGKYTGIVFLIRKVGPFEELDGGETLKINYSTAIVKNENDLDILSDEFRDLCGDIIVDLLKNIK